MRQCNQIDLNDIIHISILSVPLHLYVPATLLPLQLTTPGPTHLKSMQYKTVRACDDKPRQATCNISSVRLTTAPGNEGVLQPVTTKNLIL